MAVVFGARACGPTPDGPVITFQLWDWDPDGRHYDLQHIQLKPDDDTYTVRVRRTRSWVYTRAELDDVARAVGYQPLRWHAPEVTGLTQQLLLGRTPELPAVSAPARQ